VRAGDDLTTSRLFDMVIGYWVTGSKSATLSELRDSLPHRKSIFPPHFEVRLMHVAGQPFFPEAARRTLQIEELVTRLVEALPVGQPHPAPPAAVHGLPVPTVVPQYHIYPITPNDICSVRTQGCPFWALTCWLGHLPSFCYALPQPLRF
jgi:hypothetical protein